MVKDVMERKTDANGFKKAWSEYCGTIGNTTDAFFKGHVHKEHKYKSKKGTAQPESEEE